MLRYVISLLKYFDECPKLWLACYSLQLVMEKEYNLSWREKHINHINWYGSVFSSDKRILQWLVA